MNRIIPSVALFVLAAFLLAGCSSLDVPTLPGTSPQLNTPREQAAVNTRHLWGMWQVGIDRYTGEVDIVPLRGVTFNVNVQQFLSPPSVPTHHIQILIKPESSLDEGLVVCEVVLTHPFLGLEVYKGFDVRGIFMGDGSCVSAHDPNIMWGSAETEEAHLLNPDGYTRWWNATEFTDPMPILSFKPGALGSLMDPSATLNPYKYFADDLDQVQDVSELDPLTRGVFTPDTWPNKRIYEIQFPMNGSVPQFLFNYAVDASWDEPDPAYAPEYPLEAFGDGAQCQEAYYISMTDEGGDAWYYEGESGGSLLMQFEVYDWQGMNNPEGVPGEVAELWIESPVLSGPMNVLPMAIAEPCGETSSVFTVELVDTDLNLTASGNFPVMGSVVNVSPDSYEPQLQDGDLFIYPDGPLAAYFMGEVTISGNPVIEGPQVFDIDPDNGFLDLKYLEVEVTGDGFIDGATIKLVKSDDPMVEIEAEDVVFTDTSLLTCTLYLDSICGGTAEVGVYDVVVTNPNLESGQLDEGFVVLEYPCAPNEWGENFDSYTEGEYPSGWVNFWSGTGSSGTYITDEQYDSSPNSFKLTAYSSWARYDGYPFTAGSKTYICYETKAMITHAMKGAIMGFAWKKTSSTTGHYAALVLRESTGFGETYHWYHVLAKINMVTNTWWVWVDGELYREGTSCGSQESHDSFSHFIVGIANWDYSYGSTGVCYYDDVYLYWED